MTDTLERAGGTTTSGLPAARPVPWWVRWPTVLAVVVVAAVAAIVSYAHMRALAERAGEQWRSDLLPLSVDGLLVAASLVLLVRRRASRPAGVLPWLGLALGVAASLGANIAAAEPTVLGRVVAAWPPLAFAVSFELLIAVLREGRPDRLSPAPGESADLRREAIEPDLLGAEHGSSPARETGPGEVGDTPGEPGEQAGDDRVAVLIAEGAGRRKLAAELGVTEHAARQMLAERETRENRANGQVKS